MKILTFIILISGGLVGGCSDSKKNIFVLPEGYQGVVVIFHEIEKGETILEKDGSFIYKIPDTGVLLTRNSFCETCSIINYYYANQSPGNEIEYCWGCKLKRRKPMAYGGATGIYTSNGESFKCTIFIVGTKSNEDSLCKVRDNLDIHKLYKANSY